MSSAQCGLAVILLAVAVTAIADEDLAGHSLTIASSIPHVDVSPRNPGRSYVRLPELEYTFQVAARCAAMFSPQSVSLSIADTRKSIPIDQPADNATDVQLVLKVPAKQLAPLVIDDFCPIFEKTNKMDGGKNANLAEAEETTVRSVLSVQAALLCVHEDRQEMVYRSIPLDIALDCSRQEIIPE